MKKDLLYEALREASWRRKLTPEEEEQLRSWLATHPDAEADWEAETALNEKLGALSSVPVSSNFTARVLEAARAETRTERARGGSWTWRLRWLPRAALASIVLGAGLFAWHHERVEKRHEIGKSLMTVSEVPSLAGPDVLENFEAIQAMTEAPVPDEELIKVCNELVSR